MNRQERNHLKTLEKRMEERIAGSDKQVLHYDEMERATLRWAIKMARQHGELAERRRSSANRNRRRIRAVIISTATARAIIEESLDLQQYPRRCGSHIDGCTHIRG